MAKVICRICLRTDVNTRDIAEALIDFHDEITEFAIYQNPTLKYCSICEHLLKKFYNFSRKCRKANKILKTVKKEKRMFPSNLHEQLPPTSLGNCNPTSMKLFSIYGDDFEPLILKKEVENVIYKELNYEDTGPLEEDDTQYYVSHHNDHTYFMKIDNETEILNVVPVAEIKEELEETDKINEIKVEIEDDSSSTCSVVQDSDLDEDSDEEMIKELKNKFAAKTPVQDESKMKLKAKKMMKDDNNDSEIKAKAEKKLDSKTWKPMKDLKDFEKIFEVTCFNSEEEAKQELMLRKTKEPYLSAKNKCDICYMVFKYSNQLEYHMQSHNQSSGDFVCNICSMRFKTKKALSKHAFENHRGKYQCKRCPLVTYTRMVMRNHYQKHTGVIYSCEPCNRTFNHISTYKTHLRTGHKSNHVCVTCARTFVSDKGLIAHRNLIHRTKSKEESGATAHCEPCNLMFLNEKIYNLHVMNTDSHKDLAKNIIACKTCGESFEKNSDLKAHRREHHSTIHNPFLPKITRKDTCPICGATGPGYSWLYAHFKSDHPGSSYDVENPRGRKYMCDTCGKCYNSAFHLRDHINTHTGATPYACETCQAAFASRHKLHNHVERRHQPPKRDCPHCGKMFYSASNLTNHIRLHIQDRRYKCTLCHKGFIHSGTLREHVRGVHYHERRVRKTRKQ